MKVKIIKSAYDTEWYRGAIGLTFKVKIDNNGNYELKDNEGFFIHPCHAEILPKKPTKKKNKTSKIIIKVV